MVYIEIYNDIPLFVKNCIDNYLIKHPKGHSFFSKLGLIIGMYYKNYEIEIDVISIKNYIYSNYPEFSFDEKEFINLFEDYIFF